MEKKTLLLKKYQKTRFSPNFGTFKVSENSENNCRVKFKTSCEINDHFKNCPKLFKDKIPHWTT